MGNLNNRCFWPIEKVAIKDNASASTNQNAPWNAKEFPSGCMALHLDSDYVLSGVDQVNGRWEIARGVQSVASTTAYNLEPIFELGQIEVYEDSERVPEVDFTVNKVLDGTKMIFFMSSNAAPGVNDSDGTPKTGINERIGSHRSDIGLAIYPDTNDRSDGTPRSSMVASGMYVSSLTYTFPVDGPCTEEMTFVGNDKIWANYNPNITGQAVKSAPAAGSSDVPGSGYSIPYSGFVVAESVDGTPSAALRVIGSGVQRREDVDMRRTVLPSDIPGVTGVTLTTKNANEVGGSTSGTVLTCTGNCANMIEHIQTITLSVDLGREDLPELGSKRPYHRAVGFPIETSAAIEVLTSQGDMVEADCALDYGGDNTQPNQTVIVRTIDGTQIDLGDNMRLNGVDFSPGDTGGSNATVTYNYRGFNVFYVTHDTFYPHHRVYVSACAGSRFNIGAPSSR